MYHPIVINMAKCLRCGQVLLSTSRHDFRACECGNFVDGGRDYLRRGGKMDHLEDLAVVLVDGKLRLARDVDEDYDE
jgi:hypothetical protein